MQKSVPTNNGVVINLHAKTTLDHAAVNVGQVIHGINKDKDAVTFTVLAKTEDFVICKSQQTGKEHAFDNDGVELARFKSVQLTSPSKTMMLYPICYTVDINNKIVSVNDRAMVSGRKEANQAATFMFNRTQSKEKSAMVAKINGLPDSFVDGYIG